VNKETHDGTYCDMIGKFLLHESRSSSKACRKRQNSVVISEIVVSKDTELVNDQQAQMLGPAVDIIYCCKDQAMPKWHHGRFREEQTE
jgi:hypothetical protein